MANCIEADTNMDEKLYDHVSLKIRIEKLEEYKRLQDDINSEYGKQLTHIHEFRMRQVEDSNVTDSQFNVLQEHRKKQIDENRAVSKHLDSLIEEIKNIDESVVALKDWLSKHFDILDARVSELEQWTRKDEDVVHKRLKDLEESKDCILKLCFEIDERITPFLKNVLDRIEKLENLSDFKKLEGCVIDGAQTHLTVLKMKNRLKDLEEGYQALSSELSYLLRDKKNQSCVKTKDLTFEEAITALKAGKTIAWYISDTPMVIYSPKSGLGYGFETDHIYSDNWGIVE